MQHARQNALRALAKVIRDLQFALRNVLVEDVNVVVIEGWDAYQHFVEDYAYLVNVARCRHTRFVKHLWC